MAKWVKVSGVIIAVDFDGTLAQWDKGNFPAIGEPTEGAKEAMEALKEMGATILIHSCRTATEISKYPIDKRMQQQAIAEWMKKHGIPYDEILIVEKPIAHYYIDDSAIRFEDNWKQIVKRIKKERT